MLFVRCGACFEDGDVGEGGGYVFTSFRGHSEEFIGIAKDASIDDEAGICFADLNVRRYGVSGSTARAASIHRQQLSALLIGGTAEIGDALATGFAVFGSAMQVGKAPAFFREGGGGFAEFDVGLVDEGLFCLELGAKGGFGVGEEC